MAGYMECNYCYVYYSIWVIGAFLECCACMGSTGLFSIAHELKHLKPYEIEHLLLQKQSSLKSFELKRELDEGLLLLGRLTALIQFLLRSGTIVYSSQQGPTSLVVLHSAAMQRPDIAKV